MELCDRTRIELLKTTLLRPCVRCVVGPPRAQRHVGATRCQCGKCATCLQNARWERIFQEHFADPDYYAPRPVGHASSLGHSRKD
jgi:hypothetical protein